MSKDGESFALFMLVVNAGAVFALLVGLVASAWENDPDAMILFGVAAIFAAINSVAIIAALES